MSKKRTVSIKYTSREFDSIKRDLVGYVKRYYPNSFRDYNEASFGSLMIDTVAYIGDILSFYLDYQANETFLETATEYDNVLKIGKQHGYRFTGAPTSQGIASLYILVPANTLGIAPDEKYLPILKSGASFSSSTGTNFLLNHDVHFGNPNNEIRVARTDAVTGNPTFYVVKAHGTVISGSRSTETVTVGAFEKFRKVTLGALDVSEIISIEDAEGNQYYEVDYLSQNVVYRGVTNRSKTLGNQNVSYSPGDQAAEILKPFIVPRRYVISRHRRTTEIIFGASSDYEIPKDMISEPQTTVLDIYGKNYIQDTAFDPTRLISSDKFGVGPSDTDLTIVYRANDLDNVNIRVGQLTGALQYNVEFEDVSALDSGTMNDVINSLEVDNEEPIVGDVVLPDSDELKIRIRDTFATQNRAVTQQDYESFVYQMPPRFGAIKRCRVVRDDDSLRRNLNLYLISEDSDGLLTTSNTILKGNVKTWLQKNKMINDTIDILDAKVVNLSIDFVAVGMLEKSKFEVLEAAKERLIEKFSRVPDIGEPFFITDIYKELRTVDGVLDVTDVNVTQRIGNSTDRSYSTLGYDISRATSSDGRYIEMPKNVIYEVKFPEFDINGVIV